MSNVCYDHLGNKFRSISEMCRHYGIERTTFESRIKKGVTLKQALSHERLQICNKNAFCKPTSDHLGNLYSSQVDMCKKYGVVPSNFIHRIERGWTLKEALCGREKEKRMLLNIYDGVPVTDHLGNRFRSITEMCNFHKIKVGTYYSRKKRGYSITEMLEGRNKRCFSCCDHLGNQFKSITEMCRYHGIEKHTYISRKKKGLSLEECLTPQDLRGERCVDSKGREFPSFKKMCNFHGINYNTFICRRATEKKTKS